jgi:hypothetical protein
VFLAVFLAVGPPDHTVDVGAMASDNQAETPKVATTNGDDKPPLVVPPKPDEQPQKPAVADGAMPGDKIREPYRSALHGDQPDTKKDKVPEKRRETPPTAPQRQLNQLRKQEEPITRQEADVLK